MRSLALSIAVLITITGCAQAAPETEVQATSSTQASVEAQPETSAEPSATESEPEAAEPEESAEPEETRSSQAEEPSPRPTSTRTATATPSPTAEESQEQESDTESGFTLQDVAKRNSSAECWVAIDGGVYDLTKWIRSHPGGAGAITQLCGKDGTSQFLGRHGGQSSPAAALEEFYIGPLR